MSWLYHRWIRRSFLFAVGLFACLGLSDLAGWQIALRAVAQPTSAPTSLAQTSLAETSLAQADLTRFSLAQTSLVPAELSAPIAPISSAGQLADAGLQSYQTGRYLDAIAQWQQALAQAKNAPERAILHSNLGQVYRQIGQADQAIAQWDAAIQIYQRHKDSASRLTVAKLMTEQAQAYSDLGQHQNAVERSQAAIQLAQTSRDSQTEAAALGALGTAHWLLGNYDNALDAQQNSLTLACQINNTVYIATALNNLGNVFSSQAERFRYQANSANLEGDTNTEANLTQLTQRNTQIALAAYQHSATASRSATGSAEAKALLNLNRLLQQLPPNTVVPALPELACKTLNLKALLNSPTLIPRSPITPTPNPSSTNATQSSLPNSAQILARLEAEPDSQDKAYGYINLANNQMLGLKNPLRPNDVNEFQALLGKALTVARTVRDGRAESFALGTLGRVYEQSQQYTQAMDWTRQAQFVAQQVSAADSLYRWQWQIGRILNRTGNPEQAIAAYEQAIATLQSIRGDLAIASKDLQFDFRDTVEPVYRELIGLLLDQSASADLSKPDLDPRLKALDSAPVLDAATQQKNIQKVLDILELLKLAEIQNFFGDDCVQVAKDASSKEAITTDRHQLNGSTVTSSKPSYGLFDPTAAIVYSIVLRDRTHLILRSPDGTLKHYPVTLTTANGTVAASLDLLQTRIDRLRALLEKRSTDEYLVESQAIYTALIRPLEADLQAAKPSTVVFINDGVLRKVPMAALHDGTQFLIEKYPLATTPSLSLTSRRPLDRSHLKALIMGLTIEKPPFAALPNVSAEVKEVQKIVGGTELVDESFTLKRMQERLQTSGYPIIHMATHGKFGADASNTFLLAYSDRITIDQLDRVLRKRPGQQPIELLTLSACQTAAGDNRAALGIAGVAVRAGVKSAVATLWFINDQATVPLIEEFYTQLLKPGISKATALQQAQVKLINTNEYNHPAVWSPFILIGNWL